METKYVLSIKELTPLPEGIFEVTVTGDTNTTHKVCVRDFYYQKLTGGAISPEELVKRSFNFLLEREPNTSILKEFDLEDINRYFPEYEGSIHNEIEE